MKTCFGYMPGISELIWESQWFWILWGLGIAVMVLYTLGSKFRRKK